MWHTDLPSITEGQIIEKRILSQVRQHKDTIFGRQSLNSQIETALGKPTIDFDILTTHPERDARELAGGLNHDVGRKEFFVKQGEFNGLWKVKEKDTNLTVADFVPKNKVPNPQASTQQGVKVSSLSFEEARRKAILKDPSLEWRHEQAVRDLARIETHKELKRLDFGSDFI